MNDLFSLWCGPFWVVILLPLAAFVIGAVTAVWIMERKAMESKERQS